MLQVSQENSFLSCCLTVKNCQRILFFVPKEGEIEDEDGTLAKLEEEAASDPDKKVALMQHVHVRQLCLFSCGKHIGRSSCTCNFGIYINRSLGFSSFVKDTETQKTNQGMSELKKESCLSSLSYKKLLRRVISERRSKGSTLRKI